MRKVMLSAFLIFTLLLGGCVFSDKNKETEVPGIEAIPQESETQIEKPVEEPIKVKDDVKATLFVGKTANEVFEVLGKDYEIVGTESGAMQFVCKACPDLMFCIVPINWSGINGVEEIEYIVPFNGGKANDYLEANMTIEEIEAAVSKMPDIQFSEFESYYTELDEMNVLRYLIQTDEAEFIYEWYEKSEKNPADSLVVQEIKEEYTEDYSDSEEYFEEIPTEIVEA